jgi:1,4-alpha-glucan branching enzyme
MAITDADVAFITEFDVHLFREGTHYKIYEKLGAHALEMNGKKGIHFAVWAPGAEAISLIGDFNHWRSQAFGQYSCQASSKARTINTL